MVKNKSILTEGRNCWKSVHAKRVSFLVDGQAYFAALAEAIEQAERCIIILSWDIDSQMRLVPQNERDPGILIDTLNRVVEKRPNLHVFVLNWDYAPIYALERETASTLRFQLNRHQRIHFVSDTAHPYFAALHQKVVVIDDAIAFSGGLDLTSSRWDTPEHATVDPRRLNRKGEPYSPFHDVQMAVDDEAARMLGVLARERWQRATGDRIPEVADATVARELWPPTLVADISDVELAIARTEPAHEGRPEIREVEQAYLDSIGSARRFIYAETQYLTSQSIRDAIAVRLAEPDGPEVVLVKPRECSGFCEKQTMGVMTARLVRELMHEDRFHRLRVYSPRNGDQDIFVHAKVMIVDDTWARVASSNLSNRSMGVDNECDIIIECQEGSPVSDAVRSLRNRLLGEHLGCSPDIVDARIREHGSMIQAIESLAGKKRSLRHVDPDACEGELLVSTDFADPVRPIEPEQLLRTGEYRALRRPVRGTVLVVGSLMALALAWRFTPLAHFIEPARIVGWGEKLKGDAFVPLWVVLAYTVLSNVMVPINLLIFATGIIFGPLLGAIYALLGTFSGAAAGFVIGRRLGSDVVQRKLGARAHHFRSIVARRGLVAFTVVRFIPIASFGFVNMLAGAMRVRWRHFILGTLFGMAPGIAVATIFGGKISDLFMSSRGTDLWIALAFGIAVLVAMSFLLRYVGQRLDRHRGSSRRLHSRRAQTQHT